MSDTVTKVLLYADGSSDRQGFGGYAYVITDGPDEDAFMVADMCNGAHSTTNNRMELQGVISGLKACRHLYFQPKFIDVYCDSAYVVNCFRDRWYRKWVENNWTGSSGPILNLDLWKELLYLVNDMIGEGYTIEWFHIRGHQDNYWNNRCDKLAGGARKSMRASMASMGVISS